MDQYFVNLQKQFFESTGILVNFYTGENINEFREWLFIRYELGKTYRAFLDYLELDFDSSSCAEVEKGEFDSVVLPFDTKIITPYPSFQGIDEKRIINGRFGVLNYTPIVIHNDSMIFDKINHNNIHTFMTQNIYSYAQITGWEDLHNSGNFNIICGAFGQTNDHDIKSKLQRLKDLKSKLNDDNYRYIYETSNGNYFYVIASTRPVKKLIKHR